MIEVHNLTKFYGGRAAVSNLSFSARRGEILGFLGPNGAGKTTTMRMLTCYLPPSSGSAQVAGFDIQEDSLEVRARVGYLPESVRLYLDMPVDDYLDFVGALKGMTARDRRRRQQRVVEECGLGDVRSRPIGKLSRGYRQRVGLAQALVNDPEVLILDEPTVGLDPKQIIEIRALIRDLAGERTIILSTHILPEVSLLCRRVIIINNGKLVTDDTTQNLGKNLRPSTSIDVAVRGDFEPVAAAIRAVPGVRSVERVDAAAEQALTIRVESADNTDVREGVSAAIVQAGFGLLGLTAHTLSLEDIFVQLVTEEEVGTDA